MFFNEYIKIRIQRFEVILDQKVRQNLILNAKRLLKIVQNFIKFADRVFNISFNKLFYVNLLVHIFIKKGYFNVYLFKLLILNDSDNENNFITH
jgi:hypothetical protein